MLATNMDTWGPRKHLGVSRSMLVASILICGAISQSVISVLIALDLGTTPGRTWPVYSASILMVGVLAFLTWGRTLRIKTVALSSTYATVVFILSYPALVTIANPEGNRPLYGFFVHIFYLFLTGEAYIAFIICMIVSACVTRAAKHPTHPYRE